MSVLCKCVVYVLRGLCGILNRCVYVCVYDAYMISVHVCTCVCVLCIWFYLFCSCVACAVLRTFPNIFCIYALSNLF